MRTRWLSSQTELCRPRSWPFENFEEKQKCLRGRVTQKVVKYMPVHMRKLEESWEKHVILKSILGPPGASPGALLPGIVLPYFLSFSHVDYRLKLFMFWLFPGVLFFLLSKCRF